MTVLVAQKTKDKIILGADSGKFYGEYHVVNLGRHLGRRKITTVNNITYCGTGAVPEIVNFGLFCQTRKPESSNVLSIQRFFLDFGKWLRENNICPEGKVKCNYFIVFEKNLFHFNFGAVEEIVEGDFATDGAGFKEAYTAMYLGKSVKEAIEITVEMNIWASGPAQVVEISL